MRRLTVLLFAAILTFALPAVAFAKGPESVTITGPGIDEPVDLMATVNWPISCDESCPTDPMVLLMEQTGLWYAAGDGPVDIEEPADELGPAYQLTWVRGGFPEESVEERTFNQFLYLEAEGGPLVHTPGQPGLSGWGGEPFGWVKASDGLAGTLKKLGAPLSSFGEESAASGGGSWLRLAVVTSGAALVALPIWTLRKRAAAGSGFSDGAGTLVADKPCRSVPREVPIARTL